MFKRYKHQYIKTLVPEYVAKDGKIFTQKSDCIKHEQMLDNKIATKFNKLNLISIPDLLHEDEHLFLIEVNGMCDWKIIQEYFNDRFIDVNLGKEPTSYPAQLVVWTTEYEVYAEDLSFYDILEHFQKSLNRVREFIDI